MFEKNKSAQAALEFLMTYGWAILVALVVAGALIYIMPNSKSLTTSKCIFGTELPCMGAQLSNNNLTVVLRNSLGQAIYDVSASVTVPSNVNCIVDSTVPSDQRIVITCQNSGKLNLVSDTRLKMTVTYKKSRTGYDQVSNGDIYAKYKG